MQIHIGAGKTQVNDINRRSRRFYYYYSLHLIFDIMIDALHNSLMPVETYTMMSIHTQRSTHDLDIIVKRLINFLH